MVPAWVSVRLRAIPKSMTTTRFDRVSMTFSGLRSRCTNPAAWIASRPASSCPAISPARLRSNGPFSARSSASVVPSTNSIDTISWPSSTTRSNTRQTFAETTWRALRTSRRKQVPGAIVSDQVGSKRLERHFHSELHIEGMPHLSLTTATENAQKPVAATENQGGAKATGVAREGGRSLRDSETLLPGSRRPRGPAGTSGTCLRAHHCQSTAHRSRDSSAKSTSPLKIWKTEARRKVTPPEAPTA